MSVGKGDQRARIFDRSADAFTRFEPDLAGRIPCPICLRLFQRQDALDGRLTLEHVPPRSAGGKALLLTCAACNSVSGEKLDAALGSLKQVIDVGQNRPTSFRGTLSAGGVRQRVRVDTTDDGVLITGVPKSGHPSVPDRMISVFDGAIGADKEFGFNLEMDGRVDLRRSALSALRAAYLYALHRLGWRYALTPMLNPIRDQLKRLNERVITLPVVLQPAEPFNPPSLVSVATPQPLESVLVRVAHHLVFLPPPKSDPSFFERIPDVLAEYFQGEIIAMRGVTVEDPAPLFLLDHHPEAVVDLRRNAKDG